MFLQAQNDTSSMFLKNILALAKSPERSNDEIDLQRKKRDRADELERDLLDSVGPHGRQEALDFLRIARLSWRLRDDDNILMGRIEGQLLRAIELGREKSRQVQAVAEQEDVYSRLTDLLQLLAWEKDLHGVSSHWKIWAILRLVRYLFVILSSRL